MFIVFKRSPRKKKKKATTKCTVIMIIYGPMEGKIQQHNNKKFMFVGRTGVGGKEMGGIISSLIFSSFLVGR